MADDLTMAWTILEQSLLFEMRHISLGMQVRRVMADGNQSSLQYRQTLTGERR
jgi:hypothetical protein